MLGLARPTLRRAAARLSRSYHGAPVRDMKFLYGLHDFPGHYEKLGAEVDQETYDMVIDASAQLCQDGAQLATIADQEGCTRVDGHTVKTPTGFKELYNTYVENGWQGLSFPEEYGGQGLPTSLALFQSEMLAAANFTFLMFPGLSKGAINTLLHHASDELKDTWLPPLIEGTFTGTMCLTEPQCGSDLGQVKVKAEPRDDGSYSISGTKIFISCGDHDLASNVVHCVLARLPGAPEGTKGISLFLVPKRLLNENGEPGEHNGVEVARIENKMGCHGSPTCEMQFEGAQGWLIGTANRGLNHMFTFINTSRLGTAVQGVAAAELAFQRSLPYAKERRSMRALAGTVDKDAVADPIICHSSVRSMLLTQKAIAEGGRSMIYECAQIADWMVKCQMEGDEKGEKKYDEELAFLTPILKGFLTETGKEAADMGLQVWGGHGYIADNGLEQVLRDCRIASLWEGTTQIQALDLLGRKIMLQKLKPINEQCSRLRALCTPHLFSGNSGLRSHSWSLLYAITDWQILTYRIAMRAKSNPEWISSASVDYLMYGGYVTLASHWLRMEASAVTSLASGSGEEEDDFYKAKIHTSDFVFDRILPRINGHRAAMLAPVAALPPQDFSFDYARD
jgi:alkylation response protein AidB-like acyl-CoA dehydrogenase